MYIVDGENAVLRKGRANSSDDRHVLEEPLMVITRPYGMRFYTFWLEMLNLNATHFLLKSPSYGFIPYKEGTRIHATVDLRGKIFDRPLHFVLGVDKIVDTEKRQAFEVSIVEIIGNHAHLFEKGLQTLGFVIDTDKMRRNSA